MKDTRDRKTKTCPLCGGKMHFRSTVCKKCRSLAGENNGNWKGGISKDNYHYKKIQKERFPQKIKAREIVCDAIRNGRITRGICVVCGNDKPEAHHENYDDPLKIIWLCKKHHREYHLGRLEIV